MNRVDGQRRASGEGSEAVGVRRAGLGGGLLAALLGSLALGLAGASGCGDTLDGAARAEDEAVAVTRQAAGSAQTCVVLRRGNSKASDAMLSSEKAGNNYGSATIDLVGQSSSSGADHFYSLFRFDAASIPVNATIVSASVALNQSNSGVGTLNAHLITAAWDEATVTWSSFGGAFNPAVFKSASTVNPSVVFDVTPQLQAWVSGAKPNHGFLLEQAGVVQTKIKSGEWLVAGLRPTLNACYKVTCGATFADCNGVAADGCEADLHSVTSCGACGNVCALPHATATCGTGVCAVGSCDLGWSDCDGDPANGCETSLTTATDCGACGVVCGLPGAASSCASGSCKLLACNAGSFDCDGDAQNGCEPIPCGDGAHCGAAGDCASQVCVGGFCASPACNDHAKNGNETDLDCGGACPPCTDAAGCAQGGDCQSGVCLAGVCAAPSCADAVKNGSETGLDCGGPSCGPCADGVGCGLAGDCQSGVCLGGLCQAPACGDGLKNGSETGVDCGSLCPPCANGTGCVIGGDCQSGVCAGQVCQLPSCADGVKNGAETDVDCGGSCGPCSESQGCNGPADCGTGVCQGGHCQPASCADGVKNGDETGVDCGGACKVPETCNGVDDDCNGSTDEGLGSTTCGIGACQVTVPNCVGGVAQSCVPGAPVAEICDGQLDDDCDGVVDDGCECVNGQTQGCYTGAAATQNVGLCHGGTQTCVLGHWGACAGELTPAAESCDGHDNDCDGQIDEDLGSTICGVGACQAMVQNCVAGVAQSCVPGSASAEICDGIDNDCDGAVDEDQPVLGCGAGACAVSAPSCVNGAPAVCNPHASDGLSCNDGHACTSNDVCGNGVCAGVNSPAGTLCRASAGACDPAESCTGSAPDCPADARSAAGTVCRASAGACDPQESCNGVSAACPADTLTVAGTVCRASAGACDPAESCTGASAACPADGLTPAGTVCRASAGVCDPQESCTGASAACPADAKSAAGTVCRASAGVCDLVETCDGAGSACPVDAFVASTVVCRAAAGTCDVTERCTGSAAGCPGDGFAAAGTVVGACSTGLQGVCSAGNSTCGGASASPSCVQKVASSSELCDGLDNNCNGAVDEGVSFSGALDFWKGDGNALDSAGATNGTLGGGTSYSAGKVNQAFTFNGVNSRVDFGTSVGNFGVSNFTIEFWMKTSSSRGEGIFGKRPVCGHANFIDIRLGSGKIQVELDESGANYNIFIGNKAVNDGVFHHIALVRSGVTVSLYIDGVLDKSQSTAGVTNLSSAATFSMGVSTCTGADGTSWFTGQLDEFSTYNRALSVAELGQIVADGSAGKCSVP